MVNVGPMMSYAEEDTDCCYGLQYGDTTTTANTPNVLQLKNKSTTTTTTTNSISSSSSSNCTTTPNNTHTNTTTTTTTSANHSPAGTPCSPNLICSTNGGGSSSSSGGCSGNLNHLNNRRTRQRVDAGEPRNSYSSIPNFTSRPTFMSGGLYGAIFSQTAQQHFSLFSGTGISGHPAPPINSNNGNANNNCAVNVGVANNNLNQPHHHHINNGLSNGISHGGNNNSSTSNNSSGGFGPAKMLNELLGRQVKQAQDATGPDGNANLIQSSSSTTAANNLDNYLTEAGQQQQQQQQQFSDSVSDQCKNNISNAQSAINCASATVNSSTSGNGADHFSSPGQRLASSVNPNNCGVDLLQDDDDEDLEEHNQRNSDDHHDHQHPHHMLISSTSTPSSQLSQSPPALPQNANELAQHMLRNILQQSKKDLLAFDQEMQRVAQRTLGLDANAVVNSSELCAMISDSAKQLTKQMVKLEMDSEEAVGSVHNNSDHMLLSDNNNENQNNNNNNNSNSNSNTGNSNLCKTVKGNKISGAGKCLENGVDSDNNNSNRQTGHAAANNSSAGIHNGVHSHKAHDANNNNNENANMSVHSDNEDNSMHSVLNESLHKSAGDKDEDIELMLDQAHHHHHNHNSMDGLEKRRRSSVSPIISSSSSSGGNNKSGGEQPVALDMKRARVENIVSTMRSSPVLPQQNQSAFTPTTAAVNGCKKRKLYQPQQHDSAADRYAAAAAAGLNLGLNLQNLLMANSHLQQTFLAANAHLNDLNDEDMDDDQQGRNGDVEMSDGDDLAPGSGSGSIVETAVVHQKREEKNALKSQLRSMQEQLAEMQQKYVQLCTRMEQESDAANTIHDVDDNSVNSEQLNETNDIEDLDDDDEPEGETIESEEGLGLDSGSVSGAPVISTTTTPLLATTNTLSSNRMMRNLPSDNNNNSINSHNKAPTSGGVRPNMNQVMNKMGGKMGGNMHPAAAVAAALHSQLPLGGPFGGQAAGNNPLFHHLQQHGGNGGPAAAAAAAHELLQQQQHNSSAAAAQQHALSSALSNAWASQKLFLEQEARNLMSKEEDQREMLTIRDREREPRIPQNNSNVSMNVQRESAHNNNSGPHHSLKGPGQSEWIWCGRLKSLLIDCFLLFYALQRSKTA